MIAKENTFTSKDGSSATNLLVNFARVIVGILFIFSGLVKANDPLGLSYKMQEFFEVWGNYGAFHSLMIWLNDYALAFSITMITMEIIVGVALLLGWWRKLISWLLLLLIIFFTFLTGYAVLSGKIKTCGCFGDCIPLTAMQSFIKDIILFILILIIFFGTKYISSLFKGGVNLLIIILSVALVLGFQWHVLRHLPTVDCLPYKKRNNILELRKMPTNAIADKVDFSFVYEKNGVKKEFAKDKIPDSTWTFVSRKDVIIEKGKNNEPPIKDFFLMTTSGEDSTEAILNQPNYYLFFIKDAEKNSGHWLPEFRKLQEKAKQQNINLFVVAAQADKAQQFFNAKNNLNVLVVSCDGTALKTAARTDPALYLMNGPIVKNKWGYADLDKATK